ncbi:hypothetical protein Pfo_011991 [Paulownia fortunei]|nr:hypothetical protein Pfo_011991 [Paulownia fortunei]
MVIVHAYEVLLVKLGIRFPNAQHHRASVQSCILWHRWSLHEVEIEMMEGPKLIVILKIRAIFVVILGFVLRKYFDKDHGMCENEKVLGLVNLKTVVVMYFLGKRIWITHFQAYGNEI